MSQGALPEGVPEGDEARASRQIREMFGRVAPRYDLLNHLLSGQIDRLWRRALVRRVSPCLQGERHRVLDLCCGTGDVVVALDSALRRNGAAADVQIAGSDFSRPMLEGAARKLGRRQVPAALVEADALRFPFPDASVDVITIAFGFRNLTNYRSGLEEFQRLLRPCGCLAILEFSQPRSFWAPLFTFYFRHILPRLGNAISGAGQAYSYLQASVEHFLSPEELSAAMREAGFARVDHQLLTGGIAALHWGYKGNRPECGDLP